MGKPELFISSDNISRSVKAQTILLVDHDHLVRTIVAHMLNEIGYRVVEAMSAHHSIDLLESHTEFDALFIDCHIFDMTPDDLFRRAKTRRPDLKMLFAMERSFCANPDAEDYHQIEKPFGQDELEVALENTLAASF